MIPTTTTSVLHDLVGHNVLAPFGRPGISAAFSGDSILILALEGTK